ncbi:haloacid dehalogenase [Alsobacter metallidurans]|uniref:phosphoglycolate phosphatase n=1 Tax=Alsobacter metallidurans TaxID=340221 RepID=A0A917MGP8_9HYPH|nr:HAD family hydrolase [Alsobacter metallidurans]GGH12268.1 haloacid dehalogenase [Alsobacter metallidurans]
MALKGILFDKDGTLIDFDATWGPAAFEAMTAMAKGDAAALARLAELNEYIVEERRFLRTSPLVAGSSKSYGHLWADALGREDGPDLHAEMDDLFRHWGLHWLAPIGEPLAVLQELAADGYRLGVATNDAEASALAQAERMGLMPHLEFVAGYDSGHGGKPEPGMVLAFAAALGVPPGAVALVGDSTHDLHAARAAGAVSIAVLTGPAPRAELEPHADHVVASIADLPALLRTL